MLRSLALALLATLTLAILPPAAAEGCTSAPGLAVCTFEGNASFGDCDGIGYDHHHTHIDAFTPAGSVHVNGYSNCSGSLPASASRADGLTVGAATFAGSAGVGWYSYEETRAGSTTSGCAMYVTSGATGIVAAPCLAGSPPNPGWGGLVP